jgi:hypothetical protein
MSRKEERKEGTIPTKEGRKERRTHLEAEAMLGHTR